ncbi:cold-shock protein [Marinomonas mediterranea]|uniref:cold-shock protein n=1 Tax=Marinomonas mediterranea TaxID=119864 RepID=UPI00234BCDE7|nr:cold shock domain-containing protein [Marinomonas mediterranea]
MSSQQDTKNKTNGSLSFFSLRSLITSIVIALITPVLIASVLGEKIETNYLVYFGFILVAVYLGTMIGQGSSSSASSDEFEEDENDDRELGTVKWFNSSKGFGFLTLDDGDDVFVHYRAIRGRGRRFLVEGQKVRFYVTEGEKGKQAENVSIIRN